MSLPNWLTSLRKAEIYNVIDSRPGRQGDYFLGIHKDEICNQVIGGGQANFDEPYLHLTGYDRCLLYARFYQPGHLAELLEAFRQLFKNWPHSERLIVVDLGSGPFTGGLALGAVLGKDAYFSYIGWDRSTNMRELGERLAAAAEKSGALNCTDRHWIGDLEQIEWGQPPGWRPILVIASYLLASLTLDPKLLVQRVDSLCKQLGSGPVMFLYTNSPRPGANRNFKVFRTALEHAGFAMTVDDQEPIVLDGWNGPTRRRLRYALFCRGEQKPVDI